MTLRFEEAPGPGPADLLELWRAHWYQGFTREGYREAVERAAQTPFARKHLWVVTLRRDGELLAGAKLYDFRVHAGSRRLRGAGLAAIITHPAHRGRGHASAMVAELERRGRERGASLALLHSEIRPAFYERLGYRRVASAPSLSISIPAGRRTTEESFRPGGRGALLAVRARYRASLLDRGFGLADPGFVGLKLSVYVDFHRHGPGRKGHPSLLWSAHDGTFLISLATAGRFDVMLWGGEARRVRGLLRSMAQASVVRIGGPGCAELARGLGEARRVAAPPLMARCLDAASELEDLDALDACPWPIELF